MTTMADVVLALSKMNPLGDVRASALPITTSIQGISNALRHAEAHGLVSRRMDRGVSLWSLTNLGRDLIRRAEKMTEKFVG